MPLSLTIYCLDLRLPRYRAEGGLDITEANTAYPKHLVSEEDEDARDQQLESRQLRKSHRSVS